MSKRQRLYFRPDPDLAREEAVRQTVDAFLEFFIEQAEARGDHTAAEKLRAAVYSASSVPAPSLLIVSQSFHHRGH